MIKIGNKVLLVKGDVLCIGQLKVPGRHPICVLEPCSTRASSSPGVLPLGSTRRATAPYRSPLNLQNNTFQDNSAQANSSSLITSLLKGNHWSTAWGEKQLPTKPDQSQGEGGVAAPCGTLPRLVPMDKPEKLRSRVLLTMGLKLSLAGVRL